MTDLVCVVADKQIKATIEGLLQRPRALGIRDIEAEVLLHPEESAAGGATDNTGTAPANPETGSTTGSSDTAETPVIERRLPRRFFGTIRLDPIRAGRDMSVVTEEVVQHLSALPGAEVEVSVEISATVPDGVSETVRRIVDENCKALRFRSHEFEDE